eukprot:maker-scaffold246_size239296-snap-gene-1.33 protein:Tk01938 transcript:maker-scaffold246_size239296-snap-gene-1.33-mRNA-1 annotation:"hypothetical protein DAPPUDRAFT_300396"
MKVSPDYHQLSRDLRDRLLATDSEPRDEEAKDYLSKLPLWEIKNWLVATDGNMERAEDLLRTSVQWRMADKIENLLQWRPPADLMESYPIEFAGVDRDGSPVWIIPFGQCDVRKILETNSPEDFIRYTLKVIEVSLRLMRLHHQQEEHHCSTKVTSVVRTYHESPLAESPDLMDGSKNHSVPNGSSESKAKRAEGDRGTERSLHLMEESEAGGGEAGTERQPCTFTGGQVIVFDLEGLTLSQVRDRQTLEVITQLASLYEANYPETLKCAIVLNANWLFQLLFSVVRRFVASKTLAKVVLVGKEAHEWRLELARRIPKHILPLRYGGNNRKTMAVTEMTSLLVEKVDENHSNPADMRKQSSINNMVSPAFKTLNPPNDRLNLCRQKIHPQCNLSLKFNVAKDKTDLEWSIRTEKGDVLFAVYRRAMVEQVAFKDRVSEVSVTTPVTNQPKDITTQCQFKPAERDLLHPDAIHVVGGDKGNAHENADVSSVITVFEEVEEDVGQSEDVSSVIEVVEAPKKIFTSKSFSRGRIKCDRGYTYSIVMENTSTIFPSKTVDYEVRLVKRRPELEVVDPCSDVSEEETDAERNAKIDDLLHFVNEIANADNQGGKPYHLTREKDLQKTQA